jgi:hypothetical protein
MSTAPDMTSDATFRTWGSAISAAMASIGWVQASDTGQINWTTVVKPAAINTAAGYEIWRMNDTLQATKPVFLKIEYGCSSAVSVPVMWITVGTGTNGTGTLTGQVGARQIIGPGSGNAAASTSYFSGTSSRLTALLWDSTSYYTLVMIERSHDGTGADTNLGVMMGLGYPSGKYSQYIPFAGTIPAIYAAHNCCTPPTGTATYMTDVYLYPVRCWGPGEMAPFKGLANYFNADIAAASQITAADWSGTSRNFYTTGRAPSPSYGGTTVWAVLYE